MRLTYQYRLRLTKEQEGAIEHWLSMLQSQYNFLLADRFDWYEQSRCQVDRCPNLRRIDLGTETLIAKYYKTQLSG